MKMFSFLFAALLCLNVFAFPAPYGTKELYQIKLDLDTAEADIDTLETAQDDTNNTDGERVQKTIQVTYDATANGGTASTEYDLGVDLPAGAVVLEVIGQVTSTVESVNDNTISLVATPGLVLDTAADYTDTAAGTLITGDATNTLASAIYATSAKDLKAIIGAGASGVTGGKIKWLIRYIMGASGL